MGTSVCFTKLPAVKDEIKVNTRLNGNYQIITNKNFKLKEVNFLSQKSIISFANTINNESILETKFNGEISWRQKENIINFKNISFPNKSIGTGSIDLLSKEGSIKVKFEKIALEVLEKNIVAHHNYFKQYFINVTKHTLYNNNRNNRDKKCA